MDQTTLLACYKQYAANLEQICRRELSKAIVEPLLESLWLDAVAEVLGGADAVSGD